MDFHFFPTTKPKFACLAPSARTWPFTSAWVRPREHTQNTHNAARKKKFVSPNENLLSIVGCNFVIFFETIVRLSLGFLGPNSLMSSNVVRIGRVWVGFGRVGGRVRRDTSINFAVEPYLRLQCASSNLTAGLESTYHNFGPQRIF